MNKLFRIPPIAAVLSLMFLPGPVFGAGADAALSQGAALLQAAHRQLVQHYAGIETRMGADQTALLEQRIDTDVGEIASPDPAPDFSMSDWVVRLEGVAELDASLVDQVATDKIIPIAGSKGLVERLFESKIDRTLQPFALYVPATLPGNPTLVILLHGNPQSEAEILAMPYFRSLADSTGTIVAAPWARGIAGYPSPADADVYQVADEVGTTFHVPATRTYLAGYSNGGFSVFKIGPEQPATWNGIMCISGSIVNSETGSVARAFSSQRVYVVNGSADDNIPADYGARTAGWLASEGIQTGFYQQPHGTHYLPTLLPVLTRAWHDMLANRIDPSAQEAARAQASGTPADNQSNF